MFQTSVLASGSKGNSILIRSSQTKLLLDAGLSGRKILQAIQNLNLDEARIRGLVISHEHNDHIRGAGVICRRLKIPMYISKKTYFAGRSKLGKIPTDVIFFENGKKFQIDDLVVSPFSSSHDVVDGSNFIISRISDKQRKLAIATDLGYSSRLMIQKFKNASTIILESNHDLKMLQEGPYPWDLKQRVKSRHGHLSNEQAVGVISQIIHPGLKNIILAHLSEQNNLPELAENLMRDYLNSINFELNLIISDQYKSTSLIDI